MVMLMITTSLTFLFLTHPLSMGLMLLIQTILISMITGSMVTNYWFSYILFLVMVGGMLILFIYMTSVASNEKFKNKPILILMVIIPMTSLIMKDNIKSQSNLMIYNEMTKFNIMPSITTSVTKYIHMPMNIVFVFMILYLLLTLIAVVKITDLSYGPIRSKN